MLDLDRWREILETVRRNKLRAFLTGFSVAWGIFMLVVLLGCGQGLANGVRHQFRDDAVNSLWVRSSNTSVPHGGYPPGRKIQLRNSDYDELKTRPGVEYATSRFYVRNALVSRGGESGNFEVRSVHPDHLHLERTIVTRGRFLNALDLSERRKTAVIGIRVEQELFPGAGSALGETIFVRGVAFRVVGVFEDRGSEGEEEKVYLPISTAQRAFNGGDRVRQVMVTVGEATVEESEKMTEDIRLLLANRHDFSTQDPRAVHVRNNLMRVERFLGVTRGIEVFVWVVALGTILAGLVGVSNIMLISVRERRREFGIRKALGATPASVLGLVLQESLLITSLGGYIGLIAGLSTLELSGRYLIDSDFFRDPAVDLRVAGLVTLLLIVTGTLAGLAPASQAARLRPVDALREE